MVSVCQKLSHDTFISINLSREPNLFVARQIMTRCHRLVVSCSSKSTHLYSSLKTVNAVNLAWIILIMHKVMKCQRDILSFTSLTLHERTSFLFLYSFIHIWVVSQTGSCLVFLLIPCLQSISGEKRLLFK